MSDTSRPDGIDYVKDGTILCFIDGEKRKLRRPKTGEYKQLRLLTRARDDERDERNEAAAAAATPLSDNPSDEEVRRLQTATKEHLREVNDYIEILDREWFRVVFNGNDDIPALADKPLPEDADEWPAWLWQSENITQFLNHWRAVPLARGPQ